MDITNVRETYTRVLKNVRKVIVGKDELFTLIYTAMLTGGHILIEDNPGTGKDYSQEYRRRYEESAVYSGSYAAGYYRS